jgi:hypothetical protein
MMCPLHADEDPCYTMALVTGGRRKGSIINGVCSNCGWREDGVVASRKVATFSAGWNMPGYMPETDPQQFDSFEDAREYIADELDRAADHVYDTDPSLAEAYDQAIRDLNASSGPEWGDILPTSDSEFDLGISYWINREATKKQAQAGWRDEGSNGFSFSAQGGNVAATVSQNSALEGDDSWGFEVWSMDGSVGSVGMTGFSSAEEAKQAAESAMGMSISGPIANLRKRAEDEEDEGSDESDEAPEIDDDDSDEVNEATNEFAEEVAEELAESEEESESESDESVDNDGDDDVSSEEESEDKEAKLTAFRRRVQSRMR